MSDENKCAIRLALVASLLDVKKDGTVNCLKVRWGEGWHLDISMVDTQKLTETGKPAQFLDSLKRPPASRLILLLQMIFTKIIIEHIFAQTIADMREEYYEALEANNKPLARWRHVQLYLSLSSTVIAWVVASTLKKLFAMWKAI